MSRPQLLKLELKLQHQRQETGDSGSLLGHGANCVAQTFQPPEMDQLCGWRGPWAAILQQSSIKLQWKFHKYVSTPDSARCIHFLFQRYRYRCMKIILKYSQSIRCTQSCGSLALPGCPRGVTSQEKGPRVRRLDPQCLEPIIDSSANGRVDDPFPLWPLRLNSKYKTELYRSRMMFTRLCHERLLGAELDPILPGLNRSWDPDPSFSACHLTVAIVITQSITQTKLQRGVLTDGSPRKGGKGPAKGPAAAAPAAEPGTHRFRFVVVFGTLGPHGNCSQGIDFQIFP